MKRIILIAAFLVGCLTGQAQYVMNGKIEYVRRTNSHAMYEGDEWFDRIKGEIPKFVNYYYDMAFDTGRTFYKPGKETDSKSWWGRGAAPENVVYTNMHTGQVTAQKQVFEAKFLVQDSARKMSWKEKAEVRTIAGHQCHKAVGIICDSVYVVAFYAEDIPVSGGPEMFGGLPGMILELAIPRLHSVWTANKVELATITNDDFKIPQKGKKVSNKELFDNVKDSFTDWGKQAASNVWWITL